MYIPSRESPRDGWEGEEMAEHDRFESRGKAYDIKWLIKNTPIGVYETSHCAYHLTSTLRCAFTRSGIFCSFAPGCILSSMLSAMRGEGVIALLSSSRSWSRLRAMRWGAMVSLLLFSYGPLRGECFVLCRGFHADLREGGFVIDRIHRVVSSTG